MIAPGRYWRTLRHLRFEQLAYLVLRRVLRYPRRVAAPAATPATGFAAPPLVPLDRAVLQAPLTFEFLHRRREFTGAVDWQARGEARLWGYNLHYFDWLRQDDLDASAAAALSDDWIAQNPPFSTPGWEPYPTALRIVNWIGWLGGRAPDAAVTQSLALQAAWLERNLEFQLGANHLFVNIKALLFAGAFFAGDFGARLRGRGSALLTRELEDQFLSDGGHYELSPMYHALMTRDLLELAALFKLNPGLVDDALASNCAARAAAALEFTDRVSFPGGEPGGFNDSVPGIAPALATLTHYAGTLPAIAPVAPLTTRILALPASGYYLVRDRSDMLLADAGPIGPAHQPGHGHCDLLSFELCLDGQRLVVNCGTPDYTTGQERRFARSTAAHNTVLVNGAEQSETWGAFRVGRRAQPLSATLTESTGSAVFAAAHDGFCHLPGAPVHHRQIEVDRDFNMTLTDEIRGADEYAVTQWLHFPAGAELEYQDGDFVLVVDARARLRITPGEGIGVRLCETPRYPEFGLMLSGPSLELSRAGPAPVRLETRLSRIKRDGSR